MISRASMRWPPACWIEQVVDVAHGLELAADRLLPAAEVETGRGQVEDPGKVLVADQLERVVDPLEQAGGLDLQLADLPHRVAVGLPDPRAAQRRRRSGRISR